jgi:hypothetical protein
METEEMRVQAHSELEGFAKQFAKKYKPLFRNGTFTYHISPIEIPEIKFPFEVYIEITEKKT